ncbi:hypothetical protein GCM10011360_27590 [Primorskyibacter flagellatus]|uniref:Capsular polysaccharide transport system permease protein n=1 Tax=Primorskyibacter flagellatus TaxID=1387277 RepID=A0A917ACI0_9RHOB|nr:sugar transporter [Primorskyibacter flagellatus]GGE38275.1 hypothetical protein GCM10011360_27590 [Primorskyibacter flagellatus]
MSRPATQAAKLQRPALPDAFPTLVPPPRPADRQPAGRARFRLRHLVLTLLFAAMVPGPFGIAAWYLYTRAQNQFASRFGFVIHSESEVDGAGLLAGVSGLSALAGSGSADTDVLERYLRSRALADLMDSRFDLRQRWSAGADRDPVFAFDPEGTAEDLTRYWGRMVHVTHDIGAGLMEVEVRSFDAEGAQALARGIESAGSALINRLNAVAREDRLAHARRELRLAETRLSTARQALMTFRSRNRIVDPATDLAGEMGVIGSLQQALAEELVSAEMLTRSVRARDRSGPRDTRITQSAMRIDVIRQRIAEERAKFGGMAGGRDYALLTGDFERLSVDVEVAQQAHMLALAAYDTARASADRQTRYLATYSPPALAEAAEYPKRGRIMLGLGTGLLLAWSAVMLIVYGLRDRR